MCPKQGTYSGKRSFDSDRNRPMSRWDDPASNVARPEMVCTSGGAINATRFTIHDLTPRPTLTIAESRIPSHQRIPTPANSQFDDSERPPRRVGVSDPKLAKMGLKERPQAQAEDDDGVLTGRVGRVDDDLDIGRQVRVRRNVKAVEGLKDELVSKRWV